ncbi:hypothetical protein ANO11243_011320 [Dothideomycetidae sp. 11243]|nr:hypothetical protein ANO11243_011320 [fungal sp. No.11243]
MLAPSPDSMMDSSSSSSTAPAQSSTSSSSPSTHHDTCVVCLSALTSRAIAYPCNHATFDLSCLLSWLAHRPTCPLCTTPVKRVDHSFLSPSDYNSLPIHSPQSRTSRRRTRPPPAPEDPSLVRRRLVHSKQAFSLHRRPIAPLTPTTFRSDPALQRRARLFLRRELRVFTFLATARRLESVLASIVRILARLEIKGADGAAERLLSETLGGDGARLVLHEVDAWLTSGCERLEDWDREVQYADDEVMRFPQDQRCRPRNRKNGVG